MSWYAKVQKRREERYVKKIETEREERREKAEELRRQKKYETDKYYQAKQEQRIRELKSNQYN